jgi:transcriptional regulator with XRE-family HTH domain
MVGERLRNLRKWRGLTQVMLSQASGVAQNYISALERGAAENPSHDVLQRLAEALGVPHAELSAPPIPRLVGGDGPASSSTGAASLTNQYRGYRVLAQRPDDEFYTAALVVEVNGQSLPTHYWNSSGVEWGYLGAGPTALAYDLLVHEYNPTLARNHLQGFAEAVVARFPQAETGGPGSHLQWTLTGQEIRDWLLQQGRPDHISVYWAARDWVVRADGPVQMLVHAQFLPERRLVLELERREYDHSTAPVVRGAIEEEWRTGASAWLAWHYVRDVESSEYDLFQV